MNYESYETKEEAQKRKQRHGMMLLAATGLAVLGIVCAYLWAFINSPNLNPETLCPQNPKYPVPEQRVILLDFSEGYTQLLQDDIWKHIRTIYEDTSKYARISVYTIDAESERLGDSKPEISLCNPGDGSDLSFLTDNPRQVRHDWEEKFKKRIEGIIKRTLDQPDARTSPILEKLQRISVGGFNSARSEDGATYAPNGMKLLYIFSDMLQNTPRWSHYKEGTSYRKFKRDKFQFYTALFHGVDVRIKFITREDAINLQKRSLLHFWEQYFHDTGGKIVKVERMTGAS